MEIDKQQPRMVNGTLMKKYIGQPVHIYLKVENTSTGGRQVQGTTTDKKTVTVSLEEALRQPLTGWIEVIGRPKGPTAIDCSEILVISQDENSEPLDEESHNGIVQIMDTMRDFDETGGDGNF